MGRGDLTSTLIVPEGCIAEAEMVAKEAGVAAGIEEASVLIESLGLNFEAYVKDGDTVKPKQVLMRISGDAKTILAAERTLLNIVSRMSGVATATENLSRKSEKPDVKQRLHAQEKLRLGYSIWIKRLLS